MFFSFLETSINWKIANKIKVNSLHRLFKSKYSFFTMNDSGSLVKRIIEDSMAVAGGISKVAIIICNILMIVCLGFLLNIIEPWLLPLFIVLTSVSFAWMLFWIFPIHFFNIKIGNEYSKLYSHYWESLQGIKEIKSQNLVNFVINKLRKNNDNIKDSLIFNSIFSTAMWQFAAFFNIAGYILILIAGLKKIESGQLSVGMLLGLLSIVFFFFDPIQKIFSSIGIVQSGITAAKRLSIIRKAPLEKFKKIKFNALNDNITFKNVTFSYDKKATILNNVSFSVLKGQKISIVGKTGSGKSSIVNLLTKLFEGYSGEILIDGKEISEYSMSSLRKNIAYITQDVLLFNDTLRNNIDFHHNLSDFELLKIITMLNLEKFVATLPNGIDTRIGEEGISLSGGEKQRLSIARCLAINPEIIILDEVTSSLDAQNELSIIQNIFSYFNTKTIISISHKEAILKYSDYIFVLKGGQIVEDGTLADLMKKNGEYFLLFMKSD